MQQEITAEETSEGGKWVTETVQSMILFELLTNDDVLHEDLIANDKSDRRIQALVYARLGW
ncbi:hypothetical protein A3860_38015 [Niastella vici]|uniref:Uncharacterized protein n=1 Tax=Niastella vici TaxID=1703345 RepID=A0A1V9FLM8_9BACT|nr:hypothetical protein [Niastella vici]OQP59253.1 hypothetical protein A3860_38015 [Niastella vici]